MRSLALALLLAFTMPAQLTLPPPTPAPPPGQPNTLFASLVKVPQFVPILQGNPLPHLEIRGWPGAYYEIWACYHQPFYGQEQTLYGSVDLAMFYYDFFLAWSGHIGPSNGATSAGLTIIGPLTVQPPHGIVVTLQGIVEDSNTVYGYTLTAAVQIVTY